MKQRDGISEREALRLGPSPGHDLTLHNIKGEGPARLASPEEIAATNILWGEGPRKLAPSALEAASDHVVWSE